MLRVGDRVVVKSLHKLEVANPRMNDYLGKTGAVTMKLDPEWVDVLGNYYMYRVEFDEKIEPLAFFARELQKL